MRVLVVGGNGFLGSHIVDALLEEGRQVRVLSPSPERFRAPNPEVEYRFGRVELGARLESVIEDCDAVVDVGSSAVPASADQSPATTIANAVGASTWLGELSLRVGVSTHVYISSGGTVYGASPDHRPHRETDALTPIGTYGALKAGTELSLSALLGVSDTRLVSLRIANAYGRRQNPDRPQGLVGVALARLYADQPLTLFGDTVRDLVHASDVATAVVHALGSTLAGAFNVGSGHGVSMSDVLSQIEHYTGRAIDLDHRPARAFDVPYAVVDIERMTSTGWRPQVSLSDGLRSTCAWYASLRR